MMIDKTPAMPMAMTGAWVFSSTWPIDLGSKP